MTWRIRWPVYRIYGNEWGEFLGIWFQWPGLERIYPPKCDVIGLKTDMFAAPFWEHLEGMFITWPDVTPRDGPIKHEWQE